jgi:hypothetical protein
LKLVDWLVDESRWVELEASANPFVIVVMAHLKTKETRKDPEARKEWKFRLTRRLYEQGFARQDIMNLYRFVDWLLVLPEGLKQAFRSELEQYEQERHMPYVTSNEQMAKAEGRAEGQAEGRLATQSEVALNLLRQNISLEVVVQATGLTIEQIQALQANPRDN